jgi:hypothetical protein
MAVLMTGGFQTVTIFHEQLGIKRKFACENQMKSNSLIQGCHYDLVLVVNQGASTFFNFKDKKIHYFSRSFQKISSTAPMNEQILQTP